jgi:hypothetical protein
MKTILAALLGVSVVGSASSASDQTDVYDWRPSLTVEVDLDRNGQTDFAELGVASDSVGLRITVNSEPLPLIHIPIDGSKQFGICPGSDPSISLNPHSEAPLNALGETPQGYEICDGCVEILVIGGACDGLHFYWNTTINKLAWWRA